MALTVETERKVLWGSVIASVVAALLLLISIVTDHWVIVNIPDGMYRNSTGAYMYRHHSGLWKICRTELYNSSEPAYTKTTCNRLKMFTVGDEKDPEVDDVILNYSRSETAFAILGLCLLVLAILFATYSIKNPRYMFKRLAAVVYFMSAVCVVVSVEVLQSSVQYEKVHLPARHPENSFTQYGFSFFLVWIVFAVALISGIVFIALSRKRKDSRARTASEAQANEHIGLHR